MPAVTLQQPRIETIGQPLDWSDAEIDRRSQVTPQTLALALALWQRLAPENAKRLLEARRIEELEKQEKDRDKTALALLALLYFWDADQLRYVTGRRLPVPHGAVHDAVRQFTTAAQAETSALATQVSTRAISIPEWQNRMAEHVTATHTATAAAARGGVNQIGPAERSAIQTSLRFHFERLRAFSMDVGEGFYTRAQVNARAAQYAVSAVITYENERRQMWEDLAATGVAVQVRNVLGDAEHCSEENGVPGCIEEYQRGWIAIDDPTPMSTPGARVCKCGCLCRLAYRRKP